MDDPFVWIWDVAPIVFVPILILQIPEHSLCSLSVTPRQRRENLNCFFLHEGHNEDPMVLVYKPREKHSITFEEIVMRYMLPGPFFHHSIIITRVIRQRLEKHLECCTMIEEVFVAFPGCIQLVLVLTWAIHM